MKFSYAAPHGRNDPIRRTILLLATTLVVGATASTSLAKKPPPAPKPGAPTVTIAVKPSPVTFGTFASVSGALSTKASGVSVQLQAQPYPYNGAFKTVATKPTTANGGYSFAVAPDRGTHYRVVAKASPDATSPVVALSVRWRVGFSVSDSTPARGVLVRFSGSIHPAHPGGTVLVQKLTSAGWKTVTHTLLRAATATYSTYSIRIRIRSSARYRTRVSGDGLRVTGTSRTRTLTVH